MTGATDETTDCPLVSVVVPFYKAGELMRRTLESVARQTYHTIEVLMVDDGSPDASVDIAEEFAARDRRFRVIRQKNRGVGGARNTAIEAARGEFIAPLDADDLWAPEKIERQVGSLKSAGPSVGLSYCWSHHIDEQDRVVASERRLVIEGDVRRALIYRNFMGNASVPLIRREALEAVGVYLTREQQHGAQGCEDWDLHLRIAERFAFRVVPEHLVGYRQMGGAMSAQATSMARSFTVVHARARARNPDIPEHVFRWSAGHFYAYLSRKCYRWHDDSGALRFAFRAVRADPILALDRVIQRRAAKALVRLLLPWHPHAQARAPAAAPVAPFGTASRMYPGSESRQYTTFARISERRWASVLPSTSRP